MNSLKTVVTHCIYLALAFAILADCTLFAYRVNFIRGSDTRYVIRAYGQEKEPVSFTGYKSSGADFSSDDMVLSGYAVRYITRDCPYCREDQAGWVRVKGKRLVFPSCLMVVLG